MDNDTVTVASASTTPSITLTYGALLVGLLFATFLQGVLTLQTYIYYTRYKEDPKRLKYFVAILWIIDAIHLVLVSQAVYHYLVTSWGASPSLAYSTVELDLHFSMVGLSTALCHFFFIWRIWVFSKRNYYIVAFLIATSLASFAMEIVNTVAFSRNLLLSVASRFEPEVISMYSLGAGVDLIIALLMVYYLRKEKSNSVVRSTSTVIDKLIKYAIATGLAGSLVALGSLLSHVISPANFVCIAMHSTIGRLYTNALLANLNARQSLRGTFNNSAEFNEIAFQKHSKTLYTSSAEKENKEGQLSSVEVLA